MRITPLKIAFLTAFIDLLGFGIIIPIQPFYAETFGMSPAKITLLGASYSLMQFLFSQPIGRLSDRVGRKPVLIGCVALIAVGHLIFALAETVSTLFIARCLCGLGAANLGTTQAIIADSTSPAERTKGMGLIGVAFGLGFIFGPALGGALGQFGPRVPILAAAGLSLINLAMIISILPETRVFTNHKQPPPKKLKVLCRLPNLTQLFAISFIFALGFALMEQTVGLYIEVVWVKPQALSAEESLKVSSRLTAYFLTIIGITATIVQGGLIGYLSKRFGEVKLVRVGLLIVTLSLLSVSIAGMFKAFGLLLCIGLFMAIGTGVLHPSRNGLLSQAVAPESQGNALGFHHSFSALGRIIGPLFAGLLFEYNPSLPILVGGSVMGIALLFSLGLTTPTKVSHVKS